MTNNQKQICLNPNCPAPSMRITSTNDGDLHKKCVNWIINQKFQQNWNYQYIPKIPKIPLQIQLSFSIQQFGVLAVAQILQLRQWTEQINIIFQDLKKRVFEEIQSLKNSKIMQFKEFINLAELAYTQILTCAKMISSENIQQNTFQSKLVQNLWNLENYKSISLYQNLKAQYYFEKTFLPCLKNLGDLIQSFDLTKHEALLKNRREAVSKTNQYFHDNSVLINDKIQKLTYLFGKQMVKTVFDNQLGAFKTNCWICDAVCFSSKQDSSKWACLQQLLLHSINFHCKQVCLTYMNKVLRIDVSQINFKHFVNELNYEQFSEIFVIDRENAGTIQKPLELEKGRLWIQIVNKENRKLAKGSYIVAQSKQKDAADILISIFIYQLAKNGVKKIVLVTKDHFGITLKQLLEKMFPQKIQCIQPKDFIYLLSNNVKNGMVQN